MCIYEVVSSLITAPSLFPIHSLTHLPHHFLLLRGTALISLQDIWGWGFKDCFYFSSLTLPDILRADRGEQRRGQNTPCFLPKLQYRDTHLVLGQELEMHAREFLMLSPAHTPHLDKCLLRIPLCRVAGLKEVRPQSWAHFRKPKAKQQVGPARSWCPHRAGTVLTSQHNTVIGSTQCKTHSCHCGCDVQNALTSALLHLISSGFHMGSMMWVFFPFLKGQTEA